MPAAPSPVRTSARTSLLLALAAGGAFTLAARSAGAPAVAQAGGALWIFLLTLLISLPLLTPIVRRGAGGQR